MNSEDDEFCGIEVIKDYYKITYELNGGTLADGTPTIYYVNDIIIQINDREVNFLWDNL